MCTAESTEMSGALSVRFVGQLGKERETQRKASVLGGHP